VKQDVPSPDPDRTYWVYVQVFDPIAKNNAVTSSFTNDATMVHDVAAHDRARLRAEHVDRAAVVEPSHVVADHVVRDDVLPRSCLA
jgi:hypothetical protein